MARISGVLTVVLLAAVTAVAQQKWSADDQQALNTWKLTIERLHQVDRAMTAFAKSVESDPAYQAKLKRRKAIENGEVEPTPEEQAELEREEAQEEAREEAEGDSLAAMQRRIEQEPRLAAAIKSAGLTTREFLLTQMALFQASFAYQMKKQGHLKEIPKTVPADQIAFVAAHEKEIEALAAKWRETNKRFEP